MLHYLGGGYRLIAIWKGYASFARLATVRYERTDEPAQAGDVLYIQPGRISFLSDGYSADIPCGESLFYKFQEGDIISIDDRGVVELLFSIEDNDAVVFVTGHCNSNCIMCPSSDRERQISGGMSDIEIQQYIAMLPDTLGHIAVTGGEPTLRTETFFCILNQIADRFPAIETQLLTNARAFASKKFVARLLENCPQYLRVAVPLHGSYARLHDTITQTPDSFDQTVAGLYHLIASNIYVELRIVVSKLNYGDLQNIAKFIVANIPNVGVVNFIGLETRGSCAKNFKDVYVDHTESIRRIIPAVHILTQAGVDVGLYNYPLCAVDRRYWSLCKQSITPEKIRFPAECEGCAARECCGGFFNTTLALAKPNVAPIKFFQSPKGC